MTLKSPHIKEQKENDENEEDLKSKEDEESSKEVAKAKRKAIYKMLWNEIKLEMGNIMIGCVCLIGSTASNAAVPRMFSKLIDQSTSAPSLVNSRNSSTRMEKLQIPLIVIGGGLASFLRTTSLKRAEYNITSRLRQSSFASLLTNKPMSYYSRSIQEDDLEITPTTVLETDIPTVSQTITMKIAHLLRSCSSVTYSTLTMLKLNPSLLALSASMVPMLGITAISFSKFINKKKTQFLSLESTIAEFSRERLELDTISTVKVCDRSNDEISSYQEYQQQTAKLRNEVALAEGCMMGGMFAGTAASIFMVIKAGSSAVRNGNMTTGGLMGFATYSFLLGMGTSGIMKALGEIKLGLKSAERVYDLLQNEMEDDQIEGSEKDNMDLKSNGNVISFQNVCFSYSPSYQSPPVLQSLNFTIYKNDIIALVGENGAGKSTIAKLLTGLYKPTSGQILVDDLHPLHTFSRSEQNQLIGSVPQESILFNTSLRHNITYANPSASEKEIQQAMDQSNSTSFISKIQLDSNPGKRGSKLSGGQRQRIGLARALLSTPKFLIMDEPTSHLDKDGESAIEEAVQMARDTSRGVLIITHRKETLALVDKVIVLKEGCIVEIVEKKKKEEGGNKDVEVDDGWVETGVELTKIIPGLL